ncbi:transcription factor TFIIF complex subunit Tfg3, partial [Coemansia sp. RSA 2706]
MVSAAEVMLAVQTQHQQTGRSAVASGVEYSLRRWSCALLEGRPRSSNAAQLPYVKKVEFILHETFENPRRVVYHPPFKVEEEGWGEFDLVILVHFVGCAEPYQIVHDLNFHVGEFYENKYPFIVPNPSAAFLTPFNKHTTVARKTIPARATKARKGPPRDSQYSKSQRASNASASHSSDSSDYDSDSQLSGSGDDSDSPSNASKPRSGSSASSGRGRAPPRSHDEMRVNAAPRHGAEKMHRPKGTTGRAAAGDNPMSSPLSAADDHRQRPLGVKPVARQRKDAPGSNVRRTANDMAVTGKPRRSPTDGAARGAAAATGPMAQKTVRTAAGSAAVRGAAARSPPRSQIAQQPGRVADRKPAARKSSSVSPPISRLDRAAPALGSTGIKRQLPEQQRRRRASDVLEAPAKNGARRRTTGPGEVAPVSSKSPPTALRSDATAVKRPPNIGISGVKVPKKRTIKTMAVEEPGDAGGRIKGEKRDALSRDDMLAAPAKRPRTSVSPMSTSTSASISPPPPRARALQQASGQSSAALSSREAFVREREKQRYLDTG